MKRNSIDKHVLSSCLLIVLIIAGCKKDEPQHQAPMPRLKLIKHSSSGSNPIYFFEEFIYDDSGVLKEEKSYSGNSTDRHNRRYFYNGTQLQNLYYLNGIEQTYNSIYYVLNSAGLVETQSLSNYRFKLSHEFNGAGFVSRINYNTDNKPDGYSVYSYSDDNRLDSIEVFDNNSTKSYVTLFTYVAGKKNTIGYENKGLKIFGKNQPLLTRTETRFTYTNPAGMGVRVKFFVYEYDYNYNEKGDVKNVTITRKDFPYPNGSSTFYISAMYECTYH